MGIQIGFAKKVITPPPGIELGGYAGFRPCSGVHDPLWCKAVVLDQGTNRWALLAMDLLSIDESLSNRIEATLSDLGITAAIVTAIHSHASPCGIVLNEGPLAEVNRVSEQDPNGFLAYTESVIANAKAACAEAMQHMENFEIRCARGPAPAIGSERHTGENPGLTMTVMQARTETGRSLILYQIPCHPTVLGPENLLASADFIGSIEPRLDADMAVFLNGAAGDISTRFTRHEQTYNECDRIAAIAAAAVNQLIRSVPYSVPAPVTALRRYITLQPRPVDTIEAARKTLDQATAKWTAAKNDGMDPGKLRILKSYVEGAGVALEFATTMSGIEELHLPVTAFTFGGLRFVTVPGEIFSSLWSSEAVPVCYANGYYRYITDTEAYSRGYYEAMAAIVAKGQGEIFMEKVTELLNQLDQMSQQCQKAPLSSL